MGGPLGEGGRSEGDTMVALQIPIPPDHLEGEDRRNWCLRKAWRAVIDTFTAEGFKVIRASWAERTLEFEKDEGDAYEWAEVRLGPWGAVEAIELYLEDREDPLVRWETECWEECEECPYWWDDECHYPEVATEVVERWRALEDLELPGITVRPTVASYSWADYRAVEVKVRNTIWLDLETVLRIRWWLFEALAMRFDEVEAWDEALQVVRNEA